MTVETDLASRWLGGTVMAASDEAFGDKENLLRAEAPIDDPGRYGNRGELVDGWETRRRREAGHDWALIRLGRPGLITSINVDTSFFTGNFPESCMVEACGHEGYPSPSELNQSQASWVEIVPRSPLRGNHQNVFSVSDSRRFTHVRLAIFPDGGVARLRVNGRVVPDPRQLDGISIDLASQWYGGAVVASSDQFYTSASWLIRPDRARTMGEGWETRRRRDAGHDIVLFRLAFVGSVRQLIVDTAHFRYNATAEIMVYGCEAEEPPGVDSEAWKPMLGRTRLQPDTYHDFPLTADVAVGSIRLDAFPDGGISRVRVIGGIEPAARRRAGYRWFNSLPADQAVVCLVTAGLPKARAAELVGLRPVNETRLDEHLARILEGPGGVAS
ncbi:MAG: allantoicase [Chloroflexi bacterium]|nr:MAG: allantoicase [Chloroflexota bacterium]